MAVRARSHRVAATALAVGFGLLASLLPAAAGARALPTLFTAKGPRTFAVRPAVVFYTGDSTGVLGGFDGTGRYPSYGHLRWSAWGRRQAQGSGAVWIDNCRPSCAQGRFAPYAVTVRAFAPVLGHFTRLTLMYRYHGMQITDRRGIRKVGSFYQYFIVT